MQYEYFIAQRLEKAIVDIRRKVIRESTLRERENVQGGFWMGEYFKWARIETTKEIAVINLVTEFMTE